MQQIFVANPKGGCGKTMLSIHLASYYAHRGISVALCDHDPQKSSMDWVKTRPKNFPKINGIEFYNHTTLTNRFDVAIHDMPAGFGAKEGAEELVDIVGKHRLLIPVLPSPTDIKACLRFLMALNRSGLVEKNYQQIGLVANRVNVRTNYFKVLLAFLNQVNLPLVGYLRDTQNYVRSFSAGISLFDLPQRFVSRDLGQWQSILEWLEHSEVEDLFKEHIANIINV